MNYLTSVVNSEGEVTFHRRDLSRSYWPSNSSSARLMTALKAAQWIESFQEIPYMVPGGEADTGLIVSWSLPCQREGCTKEAMPCYLPLEDYSAHDDKPSEWLCPEHAFNVGYCKGCGTFWGGVENFDFGSGFCEHCEAEFHDDWSDDYEGDHWDGDDWY